MPDKNRTELDWEDIRFFAALAEHGTLSAAARALKVNHATVSRRVGSLEAALGQPLFERQPDGYGLTAQGRDVLAAADAMRVASLRVKDAAGQGEAMAGRVRLTMARVFADGFLIERLSSLRQRLPDIDLDIIVDSRVASLARHEADIALRFGNPKDSELVGRKLAGIAFGFYVAKDRPKSDDMPLVGFDADSDFVPEAAWLIRHFADRRFAFRGNSQISQLLAVRAGFGIGLLPRFLGEPDPALIRIDHGALPPPRELWLLMRRETARLPRVRALADELTTIVESARDLLGA